MTHTVKLPMLESGGKEGPEWTAVSGWLVRAERGPCIAGCQGERPEAEVSSLMARGGCTIKRAMQCTCSVPLNQGFAG